MPASLSPIPRGTKPIATPPPLPGTNIRGDIQAAVPLPEPTPLPSGGGEFATPASIGWRLRQLPYDVQSQYRVRRQYADPNTPDDEVLDGVLRVAQPQPPPPLFNRLLGAGLAGVSAALYPVQKATEAVAGHFVDLEGLDEEARAAAINRFSGALPGISPLLAVRTGYGAAALSRAGLQASRALRAVSELPLTPAEKLANRGVGLARGGAPPPLEPEVLLSVPRVGGTGPAVQAGMGIGETPAQGTLMATRGAPDITPGLIDETALEAREASKPLPGQVPQSIVTEASAAPGPPSGGAAVPPSAAPPSPPTGSTMPPTSGGGALEKIQSMLQAKGAKSRDWNDLALKVQELVNDTTYGVRLMQTRVSKAAPVAGGGPEDIITAITRAPGAANAGLARYKATIAQMERLAPNANVTDISTILFAEHGKEVLAAKGEGRVLAGGVNTEEGLSAALTALHKKLGPAAYQQAHDAAEVVKNLYAAERQRLVDSGLISQELGDALAQQYPWYNPMRYLEFAEEEARAGRNVKPFTVTSSGLKRLSEIGSESAILDPLAALNQQLIQNEVRIQKNDLSKGLINLALKDESLGVTKRQISVPVAQRGGEPVFGQRQGEIPGTISFMEDGVRQVYDVPDWMYREAVLMSQIVSNPAVSFIGALNGISRAAFTTVSPAFITANMANDILPAMVRGGVMPWETARRLALGFRSVESDPLMQAYELAGGLQTRFYGTDATEIAKAAGAGGGKVLGKKSNFKDIVLGAIPSLGEMGEQAPRRVVFEKSLNKTLPDWRKMTAEEIAATPQARKAAADAVEATINFGRGGYLVKSANPLIIFLNASMEGIKLPFRTLGVLQPGQDSARARWTLAGLGLGAGGLAAYNMSYPEYFDVPDRVRWGSVMVMLPSRKKDAAGKPVPNYVTVIPNSREWASFFAPLIFGMEKAFKDNPEGFTQFAGSLLPQVSPISQIPLPPIAQEAVQQLANYDFYQGAPIVSQGKQNLPTTEQTGPYVSPAVEKGAQALGWSPLRAQHALQSLFGGAGSAATSVLDLAVGAKNQRGRDLLAQYDAKAPEERAAWLRKLPSSDQSALDAALNAPAASVPVVSSMASRFYAPRGGQLEQNQFARLDQQAQAEKLIRFARKTVAERLFQGANYGALTREQKFQVDNSAEVQAAHQQAQANMPPLEKDWWAGLQTYQGYFTLEGRMLARAPEALREELRDLARVEARVLTKDAATAKLYPDAAGYEALSKEERGKVIVAVQRSESAAKLMRETMSPEAHQWRHQVEENKLDLRSEIPGLDNWLLEHNYVSAPVGAR